MFCNKWLDIGEDFKDILLLGDTADFDRIGSNSVYNASRGLRSCSAFLVVYVFLCILLVYFMGNLSRKNTEQSTNKMFWSCLIEMNV